MKRNTSFNCETESGSMAITEGYLTVSFFMKKSISVENRLSIRRTVNQFYGRKLVWKKLKKEGKNKIMCCTERFIKYIELTSRGVVIIARYSSYTSRELFENDLGSFLGHLSRQGETLISAVSISAKSIQKESMPAIRKDKKEIVNHLTTIMEMVEPLEK